MAKFWMNEKNTVSEDFGIDVDRDYYGNIKDEKVSFDTSDLYGDEFGTIDSDVKVVEPEEEEPVYKVLYAPEDCDCRGDIVDDLIAGRVVVMNIADMDKDEMFRMFDYVMGALQVLGGEMKRYGKKVVALFPADIDPETPLEDIETLSYEDDEETFED